MGFQNEIETIFLGKSFERPLFYKYPGGLRFELSEGGTMLEQFLLAMRKATEICSDIFTIDHPITVCLRIRTGSNRFLHRHRLASLKVADIVIPKAREIWLEPIDAEDWSDDSQPEWWLNVAFEVSSTLIQNFLWCALSWDFGPIRPNPGCMVYLFNLQSELMVWAYDDRGMDVVGPNKTVLEELYNKYSTYLLDYDRAVMDATFAKQSTLNS
jgi:Domain of unknown function (DUF3885)